MSPRLFAVLIASAALLPAAAVACSCAPPAAPARALEGAHAVFEARVISGPHGASEGEDGAPFFGTVTYELEVLRSWKGSPEPRATVGTPSQGSMCGRSYSKGGRYLFYAMQGKDGRLSDSMCSRTRPSDGAAEDFEVLGPGQALPASPVRREPPAPAERSPSASPTAPPLATAGAAPVDAVSGDAAKDGAAATEDAPVAAAAEGEAGAEGHGAAPPASATKPPPADPPRGPGETTGGEEAEDPGTDPNCSLAPARAGIALALALPFLVPRRRR